jgi:hypothetical protein
MIKLRGDSWSGAADDTNYLESGDFVSADVGSDNVLTKTNSKVLAIYADDNAAVLASGSSIRAAEYRVLVAGAYGTNDVSVSGLEGHIKITKNVGSSGHKSGLWGYAECNNSSDTTAGPTTCGVYGMIDVPAKATIKSGAYVSSFLAGSNNLDGTHTGLATALHIQTPVAGQWDAAFSVDSSASGCIDTTATYAVQASMYLKAIVNGTSYRIPLYAKL